MIDLTGLTDGQKEAVSRAHAPSFIMAGAGTGKTYTLSKKIAWDMADESAPLPPESLMAITFTEAAAAELLDRARLRAGEAGAAGAARMEAAWISTIHSMCRRLLSENAFDARLDPGLVVMEEQEQSALMSEVVQEVIGQCAKPVRDRLVAVLGGYPKLERLLSDIQQVASRTPGGIAAIDFGPFERDTAQEMLDLGLKAAGLVALYEEVATRKKGDTQQKVLADAAALSEIAEKAASGTLDQAGLLAFSLESGVKEVKEAKAEFSDMLSHVRLHCDMDLVDAVRSMSLRIESLFAELLDHVNRLTFDSLLSRAQMLLEDEDVSSSYSRKFDALMVDEFQDTDALQASIVERLCNDERGLSKLTTVGDRQQSIYRFRGAEVSVSDEMQEKLEGFMREDAKDASIPLDTNFRSNPDILAFVSCVFSDDEMFGDSFLPLKPGKRNSAFVLAGDGSPAVEMIVTGRKEGEGFSSYAKVKTEAAAIAARFKELKESSAENTYDGMALILRSFSNVETYINAFRECGIPCAITGGRHFYSFGEIAQAIDILRLFLDQTQDMVLFKLLAGDVFSLSDKELASLKAVYNRVNPPSELEGREAIPLWDVLEEDSDEIPERAKGARAMLAQAISSLKWHPLAEVFWNVCRCSGWLDAILADELSSAGKFANLMKLRDIISGLDSDNGCDWEASARRLIDAGDLARSGHAGSDKTEPPGRLMGKGQPGCVSIMTVHASKGLEYDVVAVSGVNPTRMDTKSKALWSCLLDEGEGKVQHVGVDLWGISSSQKRPKAMILNKHSYEDAVKEALDESISYAQYIYDLEEAENHEVLEEVKRLVYVALTRAKRKLIWSVTYDIDKKSGESKFDDVTRRCLEAAFGECDSAVGVDGDVLSANGTSVRIANYMVSRDSSPCEPRINRMRGCYRSFELPEFDRKIEKNDSQVISFSKDYSKKELSAQGLSLVEAGDEKGSHVPSSRDRDATAFGSAFHRVAQRMALQGRSLDNEVVSRYAGDEDADELHLLMEELEGSPVWVEMTGGGALIPEMPFAFELDERLLIEGEIDLVRIEGGYAWIYDYKTGLRGWSDDEVKRHYGYQALVYAAAMLTSGMVERVEMSFVLVENGMRQVKLPVFEKDDLGQLLAALGQD